jgi:hypothetical protein
MMKETPGARDASDVTNRDAPILLGRRDLSPT